MTDACPAACSLTTWLNRADSLPISYSMLSTNILARLWQSIQPFVSVLQTRLHCQIHRKSPVLAQSSIAMGCLKYLLGMQGALQAQTISHCCQHSFDALAFAGLGQGRCHLAYVTGCMLCKASGVPAAGVGSRMGALVNTI